jgi:hypothetical protein
MVASRCIRICSHDLEEQRLPIPCGPCDGLLRRLPGADHPVLSASVCGQAVAIKEICAESLRIGDEFQWGRVLYRWSCSPADPSRIEPEPP